MKADDDQELGRGKQSEKELWGILRMEEPQQAVSEDRIETVRSWPRRRKEAGGRKRSLAPARLLPKPPPVPTGPPSRNQSSGQTAAEKPLRSRAQPISRAPVGALNPPCDQPPQPPGPTRKSLWNGPSRQHPQSTKNQLGPSRGPGARHPAHPPPFPFPSPVPCAHVAPCLVPPYPLTFLLSP